MGFGLKVPLFMSNWRSNLRNRITDKHTHIHTTGSEIRRIELRGMTNTRRRVAHDKKRRRRRRRRNGR